MEICKIHDSSEFQSIPLLILRFPVWLVSAYQTLTAFAILQKKRGNKSVAALFGPMQNAQIT
jgi:hypothetical protein